MKAAKAQPKDVATLSFEEALGELESIVDRLDKGDIELAHSIEAYERGTALRQHCERKLDEARLRVERISQGSDDQFTTSPLDPLASDTPNGAGS
ncbi:MAG: exodeoxyribonuclease VII small subunit [Geminicoccaceae bacterium]|nr:MAG: exodeoxyribonuclease VII small subunit [Geminicoccaceae bacterium]